MSIREESGDRKEQTGVFISHITEDATLAQALQGALRAYLGDAVPVFVSSDYHSIRSGDDWHERIVSALRSHAVTITLITPSSCSRPWINYEAGVADGAENLLIPVVARGFKEGDLRPPLMRRHARSLAKRDAVEALLRDVAAVVDASVRSDCGPAINDVVERARRPDLARDLSKRGLELARAISERSEAALDYERQDAETLAGELGWSLEDFGTTVAELERLGWLTKDEVWSAELGFVSIVPTTKFFIDTEATLTDSQPDADAVSLARLVVGRWQDVLQLSEAAEQLKWSPRRTNVAAHLLVSMEAVRSQESEQSAPYAYWYLEGTAHTRRFLQKGGSGTA